MFFHEIFKKKISYQRLLLFSILFSFGASNIGLTQIISLAVPFLVAIYPLVIVFVIISLFDHFIDWRKSIYQGAMLFTLAFSLTDAFHAAGFGSAAFYELLTEYVPFYGVMMGWVCPAIVGAVLGFFVSLLRKEPVAKEA